MAPAEPAEIAPQKVEQGVSRIRPRARLLNSIGAELISSELVAIIELIRNCYDADAHQVELLFRNPHIPEATGLEIRDDGHGMSKEILLGPWMEPATDFKSSKGTGKFAGERSPLGRRRLGSKGVGRYAAQRLGTELQVISRTADSANELVADFDWRALDTAEQYLDELTVPWQEQSAQVLQGKGTTLSIASLRDTWTAERFERLKLALSRLVSPGFASDSDDFSIILDIDGHRERIGSTIDRNQAMYSIRGMVTTDGSCEISYSDLSGVEEVWERTVLWPRETDSNCGPFSFQINAWDLDREPLLHYLKKSGSKLGLRDFRSSLRDHSGISLYRDGFRILPYGESDNDWLRLDRRRVNNPTMRLSNNQILGWLQLSADGNPLLRDQTNREGLVTNGAYEHIREVVIELLGYLENRRFSARRTMGIQAKGGGSQAPGLEDAQSRRIETLLSGLGQQAASETALNELKGLIESRQQQMEDLIRFHAGLATTGRMAGIVFTQLRHCLRQFETEIKLIRGDLSYDELDEESLTDLRSGFAQMQELVADMDTRMDRLDPVATTRKGRRISKTNVGMCITPILDTFEEALLQAEIQHRLHGDWRTEVTTNVSVVQQALCCIFENALEWLGRSDEQRILDIYLSESGITIANNGPAIADEARELLFVPHYTTSATSPGLGLTLAQSLMKGVGGQVECLEVERGAAFRVVFAG